MSIGFSYMKGTYQKLQCILVTDKTRSTFSTGKTLHELLCKLKDRVDREDKENIAYEIYFNIFEAICSNDVNDLLNCDQLNSIDLLKILIMKGILLQNVAWKKITMLKS